MKAGITLYLLGDFNPDTIRTYDNAGITMIDGNQTTRPSGTGADYVLVSMTAKTKNIRAYGSKDPATGANPAHTSPIVFPGSTGWTGSRPTVPPTSAMPTGPLHAPTTGAQLFPVVTRSQVEHCS